MFSFVNENSDGKLPNREKKSTKIIERSNVSNFVMKLTNHHNRHCYQTYILI